ncbi:MAG: ATP-binding cassette domain-containing protein, partial [Candidatus Magasanikbacteria bacterium]
MIKLKGVGKQYVPESFALQDIDLHIEAGDFVSIVGQSGSGKTTLIKLLIAEEKPTHGKIEIGGWDITRIPYRDIPLLRRQIGVIFQDFRLLPK